MRIKYNKLVGGKGDIPSIESSLKRIIHNPIHGGGLQRLLVVIRNSRKVRLPEFYVIFGFVILLSGNE